MQSFKSLCALFVLSYLTLGVVATTDDWKDAHYQVYATQGAHLEPTKTLQLLEALEALYKGRTDEGSISRARLVNSLLNMARLSDSDCDWGHLHVYDDLIKYNAMFTVNVIPYLKYYRREWFRKCSDSLESRLQRGIARLSGAQRTDMALLRQNVVISDNGLNVANYMSRLDLAHGSLKFIEQISGPFDQALLHNRALGFKEVARRFEKHVIRLCESIINELKPTMEIYETLKNDSKLVKQMKPFLLEWLTNVNVCEDLLERPSDIGMKAYKISLKEHPGAGRKLAHKLMGSCFGSKNECA